jgi:hypothetical protein
LSGLEEIEMRKFAIAAALLSAASLTSIAIAQDKPKPDEPVLEGSVTQEQQPVVEDAVLAQASTNDARSLASDADVGQARRAYRAACERSESHAFCECVTAGVAQALMPAELRMATRGIDERISAQGDAASGGESSDAVPEGATSQQRIEIIEGHYADTCATLRS